MRTYQRIASGRSRAAGGAPLLALWLAISLAGCSNLLTVENPNNIKGDDIKLPAAATYLVNGALGQVAQGYDRTLIPYSLITDEVDWVGSRDAWGQLDHGIISDPINEFVDAAFPPMSTGRWLSDEAVKTLEAQQTAGTLKIPNDLARAYAYAAMAYTAIGGMWDNFVFSNRDSAAAPLGTANMSTLFDQAVTYADKGLAIGGLDDETKMELTAVKARALFDKGLWKMVIGSRPIKTGLVASADAAPAATVAQAALAIANGTLGQPDWNFQFEYGSVVGFSSTGYEINIRQEHRLGRVYVAPDPKAPTWLNQTVLNDPIDAVPDPVIDGFQKSFKGERYHPLTFLSAREMHLIAAEAALAAADTNTFRSEINAIRSLNGLSDWKKTSTVSANAILQHERRVNLFMQGRRLVDHYRFQTPSQDWQSGTDGANYINVGRFLPITIIECRANPNIGAEKCASLSG